MSYKLRESDHQREGTKSWKVKRRIWSGKSH